MQNRSRNSLSEPTCSDVLPSVCSTGQAAEILGVPLQTIRLWVDGGVLKAWKTVGGHRRITHDSISELLKNGPDIAIKFSEPDGPKNDFCLAYQPIMDFAGGVLGYELLYRHNDLDGREGIARFSDAVRATSQVIRIAFGELGFLDAIGDALCFINIEEEMLDEGFLLALDPERVVLELPASAVPTDALIERCVAMKGAGFRLLLDNYRPGESPERLLQVADFVKVDLRVGLDALLVARKIGGLPGRVKLIVGSLETEEAFEAAKRLGCHYFQGYYFAWPTVSSGRQLSVQRNVLLDLLRMLLSGDVDNKEIELCLKMEPALCFSLLKLVNSSAGALPYRIGSLEEILLLLGRQSLICWIQLLLYPNEGRLTEVPNPLMQAAAFRGRFLEYLVALLPGQAVLREKAFMVGLLSHLETLLGVPLEQVLESLHLSEDVEQALLIRAGLLGELLSLAIALDKQEFTQVDGLMEDLAGRLALDRGGVLRGIAESLNWGKTLKQGMGA